MDISSNMTCISYKEMSIILTLLSLIFYEYETVFKISEI